MGYPGGSPCLTSATKQLAHLEKKSTNIRCFVILYSSVTEKNKRHEEKLKNRFV